MKKLTMNRIIALSVASLVAGQAGAAPMMLPVSVSSGVRAIDVSEQIRNFTPLATNPEMEASSEGDLSNMALEMAATLAELENRLENEPLLLAQNSSRPTGRSRSAAPPPARRDPRRSNQAGGDRVMEQARALAASGRYQEASRVFFQLSRNPKYQSESAQIKYILGMMLYEMKLNQAAAFVFYDVIRQESRANPKSRYLRQSLEKLALAADSLNSDVLIRYAVKQIKEEEFPPSSRDMLYFRRGEIKLQDRDFAGAAAEFARVRPNSLFFTRARYSMGLALTEAGQLERAQGVFEELAEFAKPSGITDRNRVNSLLGRARVLYQRKNFEAALDAYREVPRDTEQWHAALFESSWAMLQDGRFRSALSNFHSLHSTYYEDVYQPESLFLRSIVYLYICRYDEMEKVMGLFDRVYRPVERDVRTLLTTVNDSATYFREITKVRDRFDTLRSNPTARRGLQMPFIVAREVLKEGDVRKSFTYIDNLEAEKKRMDSMPAVWRNSPIGQYARKVVEKRLEATQALAGKQIRRHVIRIQAELRDLFEQTGFLRFEMLSSKKESIRKEIAGKGIDRERVDENTARSFYIQNGFEYWPFKGEYWLDEIGNYHYVGVKACE
jgi:TolA-binding protein